MLRDPLFPGRRNLPVAMPIQPVRASECNGGWRSYPPICLVQTRNTGYLCVSILIVIGFPGSTDLILIIRCELLAHTVAPLEPSPKIVLIFLRIFPREPPIMLPLFCIVATAARFWGPHTPSTVAPMIRWIIRVAAVPAFVAKSPWMFRCYSSFAPHRFRGVSGAFAPSCEACVASVLQERCVFTSQEGVGTGRRVVLAARVPYAG